MCLDLNQPEPICRRDGHHRLLHGPELDGAGVQGGDSGTGAWLRHGELG